MQRRKRFLGATKRIGDVSAPVAHIELEHGLSNGVMLQALAPGLIPIYEEQSVRTRSGISVEKWLEMLPAEKALMVALERVKQAISNHSAEAEIKEQERAVKRGKK